MDICSNHFRISHVLSQVIGKSLILGSMDRLKKLGSGLKGGCGWEHGSDAEIHVQESQLMIKAIQRKESSKEH